jgi:hypothetical protein
MTNTVVRRILISLLIPVSSMGAQTTGAPVTPFTLSISQVPSGGTSPGQYRVLVIETNTSDEVIIGSGCMAIGDWLDFTVKYNDVPMQGTDALKTLKDARDSSTHCEGSHVRWQIQPGESHRFSLNISGYYDMTKPGDYEITVSKNTVPNHPEKGATVESNTITIVVPATPDEH